MSLVPTSLNHLANLPDNRVFSDPLPEIKHLREAPYGNQDIMSWNGTVSEAIDEMWPTAYANHGELRGACFWNPGLVARAVINSSVQGPARMELLNAATETAVNMHAGLSYATTLDKLSELATANGLMDAVVGQTHDGVTYRATERDYAEVGANRLAEKLREDEPIYVITICNGGFAAGIRMAIEYRRQRPNADIRIYPVRLSQAKSSDKDPFITDEEKEFIFETAKGRTLVIADEDAGTGRTVRAATTWFKSQMPRSRVVGVVNKDDRTHTPHKPRSYPRNQGRYWQRHQITLRTLPTAIRSYFQGR